MDMTYIYCDSWSVAISYLHYVESSQVILHDVSSEHLRQTYLITQHTGCITKDLPPLENYCEMYERLFKLVFGHRSYKNTNMYCLGII